MQQRWAHLQEWLYDPPWPTCSAIFRATGIWFIGLWLTAALTTTLTYSASEDSYYYGQIGWLAFVLFWTLAMILVTTRFKRSTPPVVAFPPPPRKRWESAERFHGFWRALIPPATLAMWATSAVWFSILGSVAYDFGFEAFGEAAQLTTPGILVIGLSAALMSVFAAPHYFQLGRAEYAAALSSVVSPVAFRVADLRAKLDELTQSASSAEQLLNDVVVLQGQLATAISDQELRLDELRVLNEATGTLNSIESGKLDSALELLEDRQRGQRRRDRWMDIILAIGGVLAGFLLSILISPDDLRALLSGR